MEQYNRRLAKIEAVLDRYLPAEASPEWGGAVFPGTGAVSRELLNTLSAPGRDLLDRGGKRWRPLLMTLVCESLGGGDAALPFVPLVELCHNASLIHDDIEDASEQRRGKPAVHLLYGVDAAINTGAFLYFLPLLCIEKSDRNDKARLYAIWADHMRRLHLGQAMDIHWHRDFTSLPSLDAYYTMCRLKTGCLARLAAVLGVCMARPAGDELAECFGRAAEELGVGFQILDDVKNLGEGIPGKKRGDDIVEGKKSLPVLLYLHRDPLRLPAAVRCFAAVRQGGTSVPELEEFIGALEADGALAEAREKGKALIRESRDTFARIFAENPPDGLSQVEEARSLLLSLADLMT